MFKATIRGSIKAEHEMMDVVVIGAGPAAVLAALRSADLGARTALIAGTKTPSLVHQPVGSLRSKSSRVQYRRWESNPHGRSRPEDFKSSASAIPPRRQDSRSSKAVDHQSKRELDVILASRRQRKQGARTFWRWRGFSRKRRGWDSNPR